MLRHALAACGLIAAGLIATPASATTWEWTFNHDDITSCSNGDDGLCEATNMPGNFWYRLDAGVVNELFLSFDDVAQTFSLTATISEYMGGLANGLEIVLTDGPKPNFDGTDVREHTILYLDGLTDEGTVLAYQYNERNIVPNDSYTGTLGARYDDGFTLIHNTDGSVTFSLVDLDMSMLGGQVGFGPELGLWFHTLQLDELSYGQDGGIDGMRATRVGWVDANAAIPTSPVPVPAALWLFGTALLALGARRGR